MRTQFLSDCQSNTTRVTPRRSTSKKVDCIKLTRFSAAISYLNLKGNYYLPRILTQTSTWKAVLHLYNA